MPAARIGNQGTINLVDGTIGTLTLNNASSSATALTLNGGASPAALDFEIGNNAVTSDQIAITDGKLIGQRRHHHHHRRGHGRSRHLQPDHHGRGRASERHWAASAWPPPRWAVIRSTCKRPGGTEQLLIEAPPPSVAYWTGTSSGSWGTMANWSTDSAGGQSVPSLPGSGVSAVYFTATNGQPNLNTTLDQAFSVASLNLAGTGSVTIGGTNTLTIAGSGGMSDDGQPRPTRSIRPSPSAWRKPGPSTGPIP